MNPSNNQINSSSGAFFGTKVSQPGVNVNDATDNQLMYSNNYEQETFYGNNGNISFGAFQSALTGQQALGMQILDTAGNVAFEMDGTTWAWFDAQGNNIMQVGLLPDGTYGWAVAVPGTNVADAFTSS